MPLIELLSDEEEKDNTIDEKIEEELAKDSSDPHCHHPASYTKSRVFEYFFDQRDTTTKRHPGASRREFPRDAMRATKLKEQGNAFFKAKEYDKAVECFTRAIYTVPIDTDRYHYNLSVCYGNRAACFMQKKQFQDALRDCDKSLTLNPTYVKVMMRRSKANEGLDKMEDALEDAKSALKAAPSFTKAAIEIRRLEIAVKKKHEKMKEEVFGKLKDLGNSILGNFGMSMDNFKAVQDPKTGSYSISYQS